MINSEKLEYFPINLIHNIYVYLIWLAVMIDIQDNNYISVLVPISIYLNAVLNGTRLDYLEK